jgi:hypothetical protein
MKHLMEEQLIEHFYSKDKTGAPASRHLESCADCAQAYAALQSDLAELEGVEPPERDEAYGARVWESIAPSLPIYEMRRLGWMRGWWWRGLSYAAACGLLAGAFFAGRFWEHRQQPQPAVAKAPASTPPRLVVVVLSDHLDRSERLLVELKHADAQDTQMISPLRDEAQDLLAANRKLRQEAQKTGDPAVTKALDHLDQLLTELASQPDGLNAAAITRLQDEMNRDGLLFEVRVLRSRIPNREQERTSRPNGGTV